MTGFASGGIMNRIAFCLAVVVSLLAVSSEVFALRTGGIGNEPHHCKGWPSGADVIFNHSGRIAWWYHEEYGHSECRGDVKAFNSILGDFAKLDVKWKRVVVHDGCGYSEWLHGAGANQNHKPQKIDWIFVVQDTEGSGMMWGFQRKGPLPPAYEEDRPDSQIDVYTANINWNDVIVPTGIEVVDQRLESHGYKIADGIVIEGHVIDESTDQPVAATVQLRQTRADKSGKQNHVTIVESKADATGRWVLKPKTVPEGWAEVIVRADGYAPRLAGHASFNDQPRWCSYDTSLAPAASAAGRITDESGKPMEGVSVWFIRVLSKKNEEYQLPFRAVFSTSKDGRFVADQLPEGTAEVHLHRPGYCHTEMVTTLPAPKGDVEWVLSKPCSVRVHVEFPNNNGPDQYMIEVEPEGTSNLGHYAAEATLHDKDGYTFDGVPTGRYFISGHPKSSRKAEFTEKQIIQVKGGQDVEVKLKAK
jgi:hypothetical protein